MSKYYLTQAQAISQFKTMLANAKSEPKIAAALNEFGYNTTKIAEGAKILAETEAAVASSSKEEREKRTAYTEYRAKYKQALDTYALDRRKARATFRHHPEKRKDLGLHHSTNVSFAEHIKQMKSFYNTLKTTESLAKPLEVMKITADHITTQIKAVDELEDAIAKYKLERGESEQATKTKDEVFKQAKTWMSDFYAVAKIALEDQKELLEALKKSA